jgi:NTE family protein
MSAATTTMDAAPNGFRIGIVLSAGGLRGTAHLGVLRRILHHQIPVEVMVGVSAGAIIAAYYAAVGLTVNEMVDEAPVFRGRHIVMHGLTLRAHPALKPYLRRYCGIIPERLRQLEACSFDTLHHGIRQLGIVCHDLIRNQPCYFSTAQHHGARLADVARASAAVPGVLPSRMLTLRGQQFRLADGGISDSLPIAFAQSPGLDATHLIVSDCRRAVAAGRQLVGDNVVYIRPELNRIQPLRAPSKALMTAVSQGEAAVTDQIVQQMQSWLTDRALAHPVPT